MNNLAELLAVMARLRDPERGCAWDLQQSFATIAPYTIEEAYEVAEAAASGDLDALRDELGDLLLQVVFQAQMASEQQAFNFDDVAAAIVAKMIRRHPHVFGNVRYHSEAEQRAAWEQIKASEKPALKTQAHASALDGIAAGLPAFTRALKLQRKAAAVGFDWPDPHPVLDKVSEELQELAEILPQQTVDQPSDAATTVAEDADREEELGDLLFACTNLARHLDIDPEIALRRANQKFERRFRGVEALQRETDSQPGTTPAPLSLDDLETLWQRVKQQESRSQKP